MEDPAWRSPVANRTPPIVWALAPNLRANQKATNVETTKPPANASSPNSAASRTTVDRDRSSGLPVVETLSTDGESRSVKVTHRRATSGNNSSQRWSGGIAGNDRRSSDGPPPASAPRAPATKAIALYRPNTLARTSAGELPSMACSIEVIGPDSFGSVDSVPVRATRTRSGNAPANAYTAPASPIVPRRKA